MTKAKLTSTPVSFVTKTEDKIEKGSDTAALSDVKVKKEVRRPLKPKDHRFIEAKVKNPDMPDYKAAMVATGAKDMNVASTNAARMLQNATLREAMDAAMTKLGFNIENIIAPVKEALEYDDPEASKREVTDMRLRGHDRALKLMIIANSEPTDTGKNVFNFQFNNTNNPTPFVDNNS